ncbi:MAG TPA: autotransporter domain-containing protein [Caulobacterales bacterium]|nr:autotransporter domain-containing protein [Caulobacterales bacterium]
MRIRGVHLAGLAVALVGAAAKDAFAADLTISTATTQPVTTSNANSGAGNVNIDAAGSITITAGQTGVTVDSPNNVSNGGAISSNNADTTTGIAIHGGNGGAGNTIANTNSISLLEDYTLSDTDSDGDLDGAWQQSTTSNRTGIWLQSGFGAFTGDITNSGTISVEGGHSSAIRLDAPLTGNLTHTGVINITGDDSVAIAINGGAAGGVSGNVNALGGVGMRGEHATGLLADAPIQGKLVISGAWDISGFHSTSRPTTTAVMDALDADDLLLGGSAVLVHYSVGGGVTLKGPGVEDDEDDDGDTVTEADGDTDDDASASISVYGSAPAVLITPDAAAPLAIALGDTGRGYGFVNRGSVGANGVYNGISATAIRIEGAGGAAVNSFGGVLNDGAVGAVAYEANAYGIYLGNLLNANTMVTRGAITTRSVSDGDFNAYAVYIGAGANVPAFNNSGTITAQLLGETGDAVGIVDLSNQLSSITNSGLIQSAVIATDSDVTDDIPAPPVTGSAIAIDVHTSTINVTVRQVADADNPLRNGTDDDSEDDNADSLPPVRIVGDILFGSGDDSLQLLAGDIIGTASFGAGVNSFVIDNGAQFFGYIQNGGTLNIDVADGFLGLTAGAGSVSGTANITSAHFGDQANLGVALTTDPSTSAFLHATGAITFDDGAIITPVVPAGLPVSGATTFLTADGGLTGANFVTRTLTGSDAPFVYNVAIEVVPTDVNSLQVAYSLKTPGQLGLNSNQTVAFDPVLTALRTNEDASEAFANLHTADEFFTAYNNLLPNYAAGAAELATTAIQQGQSASTNRLSTTRLNQVHDVSVWAQEIGYGLEREPETYGLRYRGSGFGFAGGIDGPLENGGLFGLSASFISSEVEEPARIDGEIAASFVQLGAYLGTSMGPVDLDFVLGAGVGKERSRRFVDIGPSFERIAEAEWWAYEGHGIARASVPMRAGAVTITPAAQLSYVALSEDGYTEEGGGSAVDYKVDGTLTQRLWADVGVEFAARMRMGADTQLSPRLSLGYRANVLDDAADRTVRFVSGGPDFTLTDETTGDGAPLVGLGLDATNGYTTISVGYEGEFGDEITRHSLNVSLRFKF